MVKINRKNIGVLLFIIITTLILGKEKTYYSKGSDEVIYIEDNIQALEENLYFSFEDLPISVSDEKQQDISFIKEPKELKPVEVIKEEEKSKKLEEAEELKIKEVIEYAPQKKNKKIIFVVIIVFGGVIFFKKVIKRKIK